MTALSERIAASNPHGYKSRRVERLAKDAGYSLSNQTAHNVLEGKHGDVTDETLRAFAHVFGIDFAELRELAGHDRIDEPWQPPVNADRLTGPQRELVTALINQLTRRPAAAAVAPQQHRDDDVRLYALHGRYIQEHASRFDIETFVRFRTEHAARYGEDATTTVLSIDDVQELHQYLQANYRDIPESATASVGEVLNEMIEEMPIAARGGKSSGRGQRRAQDDAAEAADPQGPEGGA